MENSLENTQKTRRIKTNFQTQRRWNKKKTIWKKCLKKCLYNLLAFQFSKSYIYIFIILYFQVSSIALFFCAIIFFVINLCHPSILPYLIVPFFHSLAFPLLLPYLILLTPPPPLLPFCLIISFIFVVLPFLLFSNHFIIFVLSTFISCILSPDFFFSLQFQMKITKVGLVFYALGHRKLNTHKAKKGAKYFL